MQERKLALILDPEFQSNKSKHGAYYEKCGTSMTVGYYLLYERNKEALRVMKAEGITQFHSWMMIKSKGDEDHQQYVLPLTGQKTWLVRGKLDVLRFFSTDVFKIELGPDGQVQVVGTVSLQKRELKQQSK